MGDDERSEASSLPDVEDESEQDFEEASWTSTSRPDIPEEIRDIVAYGDEGELLVAEAHVHDPEVTSFEARLNHQGYSVVKRPCSFGQVQNAKDREGVSEREQQASEMSDEIRDLRQLFRIAMNRKASDIHIHVHERESEAEVWLRIHSELRFYMEWEVEYADNLCHALYNMMTDVSESSFNTRERQNARIVNRDYLPQSIHGIRVATVPTESGYNMILRLLYENIGDRKTLSDLGYSPAQLTLLQDMKEQPTGLNIIAGPTGSGKSTTLKVCLSDIYEEQDEHVNILTVEEPPEYPIEGAHQTPVTNIEEFADRDEAFNEAIAGTMRADPDILMIGEIRDSATADLSLKAAMTGHSVWTTLHANSALDVLDRLRDLDIRSEHLHNPTILSSTIYQRLVRILCPDCKEKTTTDEIKKEKSALDYHDAMAESLSDPIYRRGSGCDECDDTGIIDRTVVAEIFKPDSEAFEYIRSNDRQALWRHWIQDLDGATLLQQVFRKIDEGLIDPVLVRRALGPMLYRQTAWSRHGDGLIEGAGMDE